MPVSDSTLRVAVLYERFVVPVKVAVVLIETFADPSKLAEPVRSPVKAIVLAV